MLLQQPDTIEIKWSQAGSWRLLRCRHLFIYIGHAIGLETKQIISLCWLLLLCLLSYLLCHLHQYNYCRIWLSWWKGNWASSIKMIWKVDCAGCMICNEGIPAKIPQYTIRLVFKEGLWENDKCNTDYLSSGQNVRLQGSNMGQGTHQGPPTQYAIQWAIQ